MTVRGKPKQYHVLGLHVRQELCVVAVRNDTDFVIRSGCCETRQKHVRDIGSR